MANLTKHAAPGPLTKRGYGPFREASFMPYILGLAIYFICWDEWMGGWMGDGHERDKHTSTYIARFEAQQMDRMARKWLP